MNGEFAPPPNPSSNPEATRSPISGLLSREDLRHERSAASVVLKAANRVYDRIHDAERERDLAETAASHDPMTRLLNRRGLVKGFSPWLETSLNYDTGQSQEAEPIEKSVAVLMLDFDDFSIINNIHGHSMGDLALKTIAYAMRRVAKDGMNVRLGGDEYVSISLVETGTDPDEHARQFKDSIYAIFRDPETGELDESFVQNLEKRFSVKPEKQHNFRSMLSELSISTGARVVEVDQLEAVGALWTLIHDADVKLYEDKREHKSDAKRSNVRQEER